MRPETLRRVAEAYASLMTTCPPPDPLALLHMALDSATTATRFWSEEKSEAHVLRAVALLLRSLEVGAPERRS